MTQQKLISAAKFKAQCLKLMDQVHQSGQFITITKRGTPVVRLVPIHEDTDRQSVFGCMNGTANLDRETMITDTMSVDSETEKAFALLDSPPPNDKYSLVHYEKVKSTNSHSEEVVHIDENHSPTNHRDASSNPIKPEENYIKEALIENLQSSHKDNEYGHVDMTINEEALENTDNLLETKSEQSSELGSSKKYALTNLDRGINWNSMEAHKSMFPEDHKVIDTFDLPEGTPAEDLPPLPDEVQNFEEENPSLIKKYSNVAILEKLQEVNNQAEDQTSSINHDDDFPIPAPEDDPLANPTEGGH